VQAALARTIEAAQRANKEVMLGVAMEEAELQKYHAMGVTMFELSADTTVLLQSWGRGRQAVQRLEG
jgi:2-keto-3-deoxy-L-rhamnonate aldolase RhmA